VISSGRGSSSEEEAILTLGDGSSEESESDSWSVSSKASSSRVLESLSIWIIGPFFSMARVKSIFGGRKRLELGVGGGGTVESFTMMERGIAGAFAIQTKLAHSQSHVSTICVRCQGKLGSRHTIKRRLLNISAVKMVTFSRTICVQEFVSQRDAEQFQDYHRVPSRRSVGSSSIFGASTYSAFLGTQGIDIDHTTLAVSCELRRLKKDAWV